MSIRPDPHRSIRVGPSRSRPMGLYLVLGLSLLGNLYFVFSWQPKQPPTEVSSDLQDGLTAVAVRAARTAAEQDASGPAEAAEVATEKEVGSEVTAPSPTGTAQQVEQPESPPPSVEPSVNELTPAGGEVKPKPSSLPAGARSIKVLVEGPISRGFEKAVGGSGVRLAMVASRLLVWNLNLTRDPRKGDTIDLIYTMGEGSEGIVIHALRYRSQKFSRSFEAYRYQPEGRAYASYFDEQGREVPARLRDSPIASYQEITSLIGDGRGHQGMDFKAPVGTPILAPWDGQILRKNWNWKYNGNSLELSSHDGRRVARFLHLDKLADGIGSGVRVKKGQRLADSGNTGRSFAPHLHYEISDGSGRVLDPLDVHETHHPRLSGAALQGFEEVMTRLGAGLGD